MKRQIRLKEFSKNVDKIHIPSQSYLNTSFGLDNSRAYLQKLDSNGFMSSGFLGERMDVIVLGDSFVESIYVDISQRFTFLIENYFLKDGLSVNVYNAGVSGSTGLGLLNLYLNKIIPLKPKAIIYVQPSCDFSALLFADGYYNDSQFFSNLVPAKDTDEFVFETIENNSSQILHNISLLSQSCKINGIQLFLATCCSNSPKRQLKVMNDIIRNNSQIGYEVIDLDVLVERGSHNFYDKQHLNAQGSHLVANLFKCALKKTFTNFNSEYKKNIIESIYDEKWVGEVYSKKYKLLNGRSEYIILFIDLYNNYNCEDKENHILLEMKYYLDSKLITSDVAYLSCPYMKSIEQLYIARKLEVFDELEIILKSNNESIKLINLNQIKINEIFKE